MRLAKKHPLLFKFVKLQAFSFACALAGGLIFVVFIIPQQKRSQIVNEMIRACRVLQRIERDRQVAAPQALEIFLKINRAFFANETVIRKVSDPDVVPGAVSQPDCTPLRFSFFDPRLQLRLDADSLLETSTRPPSMLSLQMKLDRQGPGFYEIQHHHPVIWGMTPEGAASLVLMGLLVASFVSSFAIGGAIFGRAVREATDVIARFRNGDLKARFTAGENPLGDQFNRMASEIEKLIHQVRDAENVRVNLLQELAHDLKTPVASQRALLESLRERHAGMQPKELEGFLETSIHETFYFGRLVDDLLFVSGVKEIAATQGTRKLDLIEIARAESQAFSQGLGIACEFLGLPSVSFMGEENLIRRVFRNAFDNAFSFANERIEVHVGETETHWIFDIVDDGFAVSLEDAAQFGNKRSTRQVRVDRGGRISIGMGSVIMRKIARSYGGDALLEPRRDRVEGSQLRVSFRKQQI